MKDLFDPTLADDTKQRIMRLHPESERRWGNMTLAQTLAHCTSGIQMATGVINPKRASFPANVIGLVIKPLVFGDDKPMRRNSASSPELFSADPTQCDFERERTQLIATIDSFVTKGSACCSQHPHPFFGPLKPQQWAILMYKHVDHHLRQFGVYTGLTFGAIRGHQVLISRLAGSDLRAWRRFWSDYGQTGSNPQVLVNAVIGQVESWY